MTTYIANLDLAGKEMERPFMRTYVEAENEQEAREAAQRGCDDDMVVRSVEELQPILVGILDGINAGKRYTICWKDEGRVGPVYVTDLDLFESEVPANENGVRIGAVPFGSQPSWETAFPWTTRAEARRLAKYLGLDLQES